MENKEDALAEREEDLAERLEGTPLEGIAEGVAALVAAAPWVGGPVSAVVTGRTTARKIGRVNDALLYLADRINDVEATLDADTVKSEEFEELLDVTLPKIARERTEEKRKLYALYLGGALLHPDVPYDEKLRFLDTLDRLQPAHIALLRAYMQHPDATRSTGIAGSQMQTLRRRLPDFEERLIEDLVTQLADLRLVQAQGLKAMMTAAGAEDMRSRVTPFGERFIGFLLG